MKYKVGDKIRIIEMSGEPEYCGSEGIIEYIDDEGQLHGTWGVCAIIPKYDYFIKINQLCERVNKKKEVKTNE